MQMLGGRGGSGGGDFQSTAPMDPPAQKKAAPAAAPAGNSGPDINFDDDIPF